MEAFNLGYETAIKELTVNVSMFLKNESGNRPMQAMQTGNGRIY